jgi:hypothetical protein
LRQVDQLWERSLSLLDAKEKHDLNKKTRDESCYDKYPTEIAPAIRFQSKRSVSALGSDYPFSHGEIEPESLLNSMGYDRETTAHLLNGRLWND